MKNTNRLIGKTTTHEEIKLVIQAYNLNPRVYIKQLKKGLLNTVPLNCPVSHNQIYFTDAGYILWNVLSEIDSNIEILTLKNTSILGRSANWLLSLKSNNYEILLECKQYFIPLAKKDGADSVALLITIRGRSEDISTLVHKFKNSYKQKPYNITKWDKFEKKFCIKREECLDIWRRFDN